MPGPTTGTDRVLGLGDVFKGASRASGDDGEDVPDGRVRHPFHVLRPARVTVHGHGVMAMYDMTCPRVGGRYFEPVASAPAGDRRRRLEISPAVGVTVEGGRRRWGRKRERLLATRCRVGMREDDVTMLLPQISDSGGIPHSVVYGIDGSSHFAPVASAPAGDHRCRLEISLAVGATVEGSQRNRGRMRERLLAVRCGAGVRDDDVTVLSPQIADSGGVPCSVVYWVDGSSHFEPVASAPAGGRRRRLEIRPAAGATVEGGRRHRGTMRERLLATRCRVGMREDDVTMLPPQISDSGGVLRSVVYGIDGSSHFAPVASAPAGDHRRRLEVSPAVGAPVEGGRRHGGGMRERLLATRCRAGNREDDVTVLSPQIWDSGGIPHSVVCCIDGSSHFEPVASAPASDRRRRLEISPAVDATVEGGRRHGGGMRERLLAARCRAGTREDDVAVLSPQISDSGGIAYSVVYCIDGPSHFGPVASAPARDHRRRVEISPAAGATVEGGRRHWGRMRERLLAVRCGAGVRGDDVTMLSPQISDSGGVLRSVVYGIDGPRH